jgi:LemA protein
MFGYQTKPNFTVENEQQIQQAPSVDFGAPAPPPTQAPPMSQPLPAQQAPSSQAPASPPATPAPQG